MTLHRGLTALLILLIGAPAADACTASAIHNQIRDQKDTEVFERVHDLVVETMAPSEGWQTEGAIDAAAAGVLIEGSIYMPWIQGIHDGLYKRGSSQYERIMKFLDGRKLPPAWSKRAYREMLDWESVSVRQSDNYSTRFLNGKHMSAGVVTVSDHAILHGWEEELGTFDTAGWDGNFRPGTDSRPTEETPSWDDHAG
jgi:hypothetical protein